MRERLYFYILAGITFALVGWNLGQFFITDLHLLRNLPSLILFPFIAMSLAVGMVLNEIFLTNPTRTKLNLRRSRKPLQSAAMLGLLSGLVAGLLNQIILDPNIPIGFGRESARIVRILSWAIIGIGVGFAEGFTWRQRSLEAGDRKRSKQRLLSSLAAGWTAGLLAALLFEVVRLILGGASAELQTIEEPIGIAILGALLGIALSFTTSPTYQAALRAGKGFELVIDRASTQLGGRAFHLAETYPRILIPDNAPAPLKFVSCDIDVKPGQDGRTDEIEEGLSIQLPVRGTIRIGSAIKVNIQLPGTALHVADLDFTPRKVSLSPNSRFFYTIEVNGIGCLSANPVTLKHNDIITIKVVNSEQANGKELYRFVYYNRFLDPQA